MIKKTGMILIAALILMNCGGGDTEATRKLPLQN